MFTPKLIKFASCQKQNSFIGRKRCLSFFILFFIFLGLVAPKESLAVTATTETASAPSTIRTVIDKLWDGLKKAAVKAGSSAFQKTLSSTVNKLAFDMATYVGSGGKGQAPLALKDPWGTIAKNAGDAASAGLIEGLNSWGNINLCEPNLDVKVKLGLGLIQYADPGSTTYPCDLSKAKNAWKTDITKKWAAMNDRDYLKKYVSESFAPTGNDLTVSFSLMSGMAEEKKNKTAETLGNAQATKGWLDIRGLGGELKDVPGSAEAATNLSKNATWSNVGKYTGSALVDAANIFGNQLAITALNTAMSKIFDRQPGSTATDFDALKNNFTNLNNPDSDPASFLGIGTKLAELAKPRFDVKTNYDILGDLASCPDPANPGPTNCVIDDKFRQGIEEQKTIIEAIDDGYLNKDWNFKGKIDYNQGYSLRSMIILRKYRIIPVGWEEAVNRIVAGSGGSGVPRNATLMDLVSCYDANDQYVTFSRDFDVNDVDWCRGLIDPNWVLKASLNYCKRLGYGGQIINKELIDTADPLSTTGATKKEVLLTRAEDYCADEQGCVKEKEDGSCEAYGYCTEERRTWKFNSDSCAPVFNTCRTFQNSSGVSASYLENTLNSDNCNASNAGCKPYAISGAYDSASDSMAWKKGGQIFLNNKTDKCTADQEGCTQLIRVKSDYGFNLLKNSDFEDSDISSWSNPIGSYTPAAASVPAVVSGGYSSSNAFSIPSGNGGYRAIAVRTPFPDLAGQTFSLSMYAKGCDSADDFSFIDPAISASPVVLVSKKFNVGSDWQYYSVSFTYPSYSNFKEVSFMIRSHTCVIDRVKLELGAASTAYSSYGSNNVVYEKLIPSYLDDSCYVDAATKNYHLKDNALTKCSNYARRCSADEAGCELYSDDSGLSIAAQAKPGDYCPANCLGYDTYIQKDTYFNQSQGLNLIPTTARDCSIEAVGCNEFTNLDELAGGGESREYYVNLRQCIKPDINQCVDYYYWEGSAGAGYELKQTSLKKGSSGPAVTINDSSLCNAAIYSLPASNPLFNSDCREFYDKSGTKTYHLTSRTITCSDQCKPFRLSYKNVSPTITTSSACTGTDKGWLTASSQCIVCQNGGTWDNNQGACVYYAIPGEGKTCRAEDNGCREYNGNKGSNVRLVKSYDFDSGVASFNLPSGSGVSTESTVKNGQSLKLSGTGSTLVGDEVIQGKSYILKFMAKATSATNLQASLQNGETTPKSAAFGLIKNETKTNSLSISGDGQWQVYQLSLESLDHEVDKLEKLILTSSGTVYLDNVILNEVTDRYYLFEKSWNTPDVCYYDMSGNYQGLNYNLGCSQYIDRTGVPYNLRQFSRLCVDTAVGCELMIETNNSNDYRPAAYNKTGQSGAVMNAVCDSADGYDCINVAGDNYVYAVFDQGKSCSDQSKGCTRVGESQGSSPDLTTQTLYKDAYVKIDPEKYEQSLCHINEVGCEAWSYTDGQNVSQSYFRDPGNQVCEWRTGSLYSQEQWYKKKVKRCSGDANRVCLTNTDCTGLGVCQTSTDDVVCPVSSLKTVGVGGKGNDISQPNSGWVGACEAAASGCTELIDPVSIFNPNVISNSTFSPETVVATWLPSADNSSIYQTVSLEKNKLYIFETNNNNLSNLKCSGPLRILDSNNVISTTVTSDINISASTQNKVIFLNSNNGDNDFDSFTNCTSTVAGPLYANVNKEISLRASIVDYKLGAGLDRSSCNGSANTDIGCIIFNERQASSVNKKLSWDAAASYGKQVNCDSGKCDSNSILKVRPSRVCDKWLACASEECLKFDAQGGCLQKGCSGQGECNEMGTDGNCLSFIKKQEDLHEFNPAVDKNSSGYSKLGYNYFSNMTEIGQGLAEYHWNFEDSNSLSLLGVDYNSIASTTQLCKTPQENQISYPAQGSCYSRIVMDKTQASNLKYPGVTASANIYNHSGSDILFGARSDVFKVRAGKTYYISYLINTDATQGSSRMLFHYYSGSDWTSAVFVGDELKTDSSDNFSPDKSESGWRRVIHEFTPKADLAEFFLGMAGDTNNKTVYYDDINIEPVEKIASSTDKVLYVSKSCRLYPKQNSLTCKSDDPTVYANGLYGYCLETDPNNSNVCLMWLPVDSISSSEAANDSASTGFYGYAGGAPNPFYCAEANGNFKYLEKREAKHVGSRYEYYDYGNGGYTRRYCISSSLNFTGCPASYNLHTTDSSRVVDVCGSTDYLLLKFDDIFNVSGADSEYCFYHFTCIPNGIGRVFADPPKTITVPDIPCNGCGKTTGDTITVNTDGWYVHNGFTVAPASFNYRGGNSMTSLGMSELSNNDPNPIKIYDNYNPPASAAALKNVDEFYPYCRVFVSGAKPWVKRLTTYNGNPYFFGQENSSTWRKPFDGYLKTKTNAPYGSANITSNSGIPSHLSLGPNNAGAPYGCLGGSSESDGCPKIGVCSNDTNKYCLVVAGFTGADDRQCGGSGGGNPCVSVGLKSYDPASNKNVNRTLANIFYAANDVFDYTGASIKASSFYYYDSFIPKYITPNIFNKGSNSGISACPASGRPSCQTDPVGCFCYIKPIVYNVRILNPGDGGKINIGATDHKFEITRPGFYTLKFNTTVDAEQAPIKNLFVKFGSDYSRNNIDAGNHELIRLLSPGTYTLNIFVTDNWDHYGEIGTIVK